MNKPILTIKMQSKEQIHIQLFPEITPNSVNSVISLAQKGCYNGREIYRIVKDFVLQTGCEENEDFPNGCDYIIDGEYSASGHPVQQPAFTKGMVGMAGLGNQSNVSDGSSFFIMTGEYPGLDGNFAVIGQVIEGMEAVERLNQVAVKKKMMGTIPIHQPVEPEIMEEVRVETFGIAYPEPKTKAFTEAYSNMERELAAIRKNDQPASFHSQDDERMNQENKGV